MLAVLLLALVSGLLCQACNVPPELWCDSPAIAQKCGAVAACASFKRETLGKKVNVTLFYESLCPGCRNFIKETLYPEVYKKYGSIVNVELVPFGNAVVKGGKITCQHGPDECSLNIIHSCGLKHLSAMGFDWVHCLESAYPASPTKAFAQCTAQLRLSSSQISTLKSCWSGPEGSALALAAGRRTAAAAPDKHEWVPWLLLADTSLQRAQSFLVSPSLPASLCEWYQSKEIPSVCQVLNNINTDLSHRPLALA